MESTKVYKIPLRELGKLKGHHTLILIALFVLLFLGIGTPLLLASGVLVAILALIFGNWNNKKQKEILKSYQIEMNSFQISYQHVDLSVVRINKNMIAAIYEDSGGLYLHTHNVNLFMNVPKTLEDIDYQEIKKELAKWAPIESMIATERKKKIVRIALIVSLCFTPILDWFDGSWRILLTCALIAGMLANDYLYNKKVRGITLKEKRFLPFGVFIILFMFGQ